MKKKVLARKAALLRSKPKENNPKEVKEGKEEKEEKEEKKEEKETRSFKRSLKRSLSKGSVRKVLSEFGANVRLGKDSKSNE